MKCHPHHPGIALQVMNFRSSGACSNTPWLPWAQASDSAPLVLVNHLVKEGCIQVGCDPITQVILAVLLLLIGACIGIYYSNLASLEHISEK